MADGLDESLYVKIRGLPWSATPKEIVDFFNDCQVKGGEDGVFLVTKPDGRASGDAYVEMVSLEDKEAAFMHHKKNMGRRYIEVMECREGEVAYSKKIAMTPSEPGKGDGVLRLRGLPYGCSVEQVAQFFAGYEIVPNGITILYHPNGQTTGTAYVRFVSSEVSERASERKNERIERRYIEIFDSNLEEVRSALQRTGMMMDGGPRYRPTPYDRPDRYSGGGGGGGGGGYGGRSHRGYDSYEGGRGGGGGGRGGGSWRGSTGDGETLENYRSSTGHTVHLGGLPFQCVEQEIADFFAGLNPVRIVIHYRDNGRATGEADVDFESHEEACEAMKKDKSNIQHRYIDLTLNSRPRRSMGGGRMGGGGHMGGHMGGGGGMGGDMGGSNVGWAGDMVSMLVNKFSQSGGGSQGRDMTGSMGNGGGNMGSGGMGNGRGSMASGGAGSMGSSGTGSGGNYY